MPAVDRLRDWWRGPADQRSLHPEMSLPEYLRLWESFAFGGVHYLTPGSAEGIKRLTAEYGAFNAVVGTCLAIRAAVFSEARFAWQQFVDGRPNKLFSDRQLAALERPWPGANQADLLNRMEADDSVYGGSYWVRPDGEFIRIDPLRTIVLSGDFMVNGRVVGKRLLGYGVRDPGETDTPLVFLPGEVTHYYSTPHPTEPFVGRSWVQTILADATADDGLTEYKHSFIRNAGVSALAITYPEGMTLDEVKAYKEALDNAHKGVTKAFKTLHLGLGAKVEKVGANFEELNMKTVQGQGESRIAAASGVGAVIANFSEGMQGSSLNTGNYQAARRRFSDITMRSMWRQACGALENLVAPPPGRRLWYWEPDIPFLQEDVLDAAAIMVRQSSAMKQLVEAGFEPKSVTAGVTAYDLSNLTHTGKTSVQLQPPADEGDDPLDGDDKGADDEDDPNPDDVGGDDDE